MKGIDGLRARFDALEPRERLFLAAGAAALVIFAVYLALVRPLVEYREQAQAGVASRRALVAWMQGAVEVLRERGPAAPAVNTSGSLLALVDTSARAAGLAGGLRRIQQEGDDAVRVRLESASFDSLVLWLDSLRSRHGVTASEATVDRADQPGLVNASITLSRGAES